MVLLALVLLLSSSLFVAVVVDAVVGEIVVCCRCWLSLMFVVDVAVAVLFVF